MSSFSIFPEIHSVIDEYEHGQIELADGLLYSQKEIIDTTYYMWLSKFQTGNKDDLGRDKPFENKVNFPVDIEVTATDIDTKNILVEADEPAFEVQALLLSKEIYNWMKSTNFAHFLNKFGETLSRFGGVLVKRSYNEDKELEVNVVNWLSVATDQVDINEGSIVETHYMTPVQLKQMKGWDNIDEAIEAHTRLEVTNEGNQSNTSKIEVKEFEGVISRACFTGNEDDKNDFSLQHYFVVECGTGKDKEEIILFKEELKNGRNYKYLSRKEIEGRALGLGVTEQNFETQWWVNDAKIMEKRAIEIASKVLFKTNDETILENNVTTDTDVGDIIFLEDGKDFNQVNTVSNSIPVFQNIINSWEENSQKLNGTFEGVSGGQFASGTPFRSALLATQTANNRYSQLTERKGIFLKELFTDWVIPELTKRINKEHILKAGFSPEELKMIDNRFATWESMQKAYNIITERFDGNADKNVESDEFDTFTQTEFDALVEEGVQLLQESGNRRFLDIPKKFFNFKYQITVVTTGEQKEKSATLQSLNTIFETVVQNPQVLQDPIIKSLYEKMLITAGISPISLGIDFDSAPQQPIAPPQEGGDIQTIEALGQATGQTELTI